MSWAPWFAHIQPVRGYAAGAIVAKAGGICHQENIEVSGVDFSGLFDGSKTSVMIGGTKYMRLHGDNEMVMLRGKGCPAAVAATASLYLFVVGADNAASGNLSMDLARSAETFKGSGL